MIEFVTLFLGLAVGVQQLEVSVAPEVAKVEILLDGESVATMSGEPWRRSLDFGPRLLPRHLQAIALAADGDELARAEQWINLPRPRAEAKISVETDTAGSARWARVIWEAIDFEAPDRIEVFLDGRPLEVEDPNRIRLPKTAPENIHLLTAELEFSDTVLARAEAVFGGTYGDTVSSELTAIVLENERSRPPKPDRLQGRILHRGSPVKVVAVERPPIDILIVREHSNAMFDSIQRLLTTGTARRSPMRTLLPEILRPADRVRFALTAPEGEPATAGRYEQIPVTPDLMRSRQASLLKIITRIGPIGSRQALASERIADAVAVAGLVASSGNRRRAVILLTAFESEDVSRLAPEASRDFLNSLTVPLAVWQLNPPGRDKQSPPGSWGPAIDISDWGGVTTAFRELEEALDSQFLVWIEGRYLQREISIAPGQDGLRLAQRDLAHLEEEIRRLAAAGGLIGSPGETRRAAPAPVGRRTLLDTERLERAQAMLGSPSSFVPLGPVSLITDDPSPGLWKTLEQVAHQVPQLYSRHYELAVDLDEGAMAVLFAKQATYRAYQAESGVAGGDLAGHASSGLIVMYSQGRSQSEVGDTFLHELVHLLNLRLFGPDLPPWLNEGLAESTTFVRHGGDGSLTLGPLDPRRLRAAGAAVLPGTLSLVDEILERAARQRLPRLEDLTTMDNEAFTGGDSADLRYALAALWVHYLGTADPTLAPGFRDYLAAVATGAVDSSDAAALEGHLELGLDELEQRFLAWLEWLAIELPVH